MRTAQNRKSIMLKGAGADTATAPGIFGHVFSTRVSAGQIWRLFTPSPFINKGEDFTLVNIPCVVIYACSVHLYNTYIMR